MHKQTPPRRKSIGQAMVEFALALPLLLLITYGMLETGRLLFIYGTTVTAARQAARYGSTSGMSENGVPYYRDCAGIEAAVNNLGFIHTFNDINITYDRGLDSSGNEVAIPGYDPDPSAYTCNSMNDTTLQNGDRIKVQASTAWTPILSIVPSWQGFTITSSAERTILKSVAVGVDPAAQQWIPGGALTLAVSSTTPSYDEVGDVIYYSYTLTNVTNTSPTPFNLNAPFNVIDNQAVTSCAGAPNPLTPGASFTCSGYHTVTQADIDNGFVTNLAGATSLETTSNQTGVTVFAVQNKVLTLDKSPDQEVVTTVGSAATYTYTLTNNGNVTLTAPYSITDNKISSAQINCTSAASPLAPGASTTCAGTYTITADDVSNGSVTNIASATARFNGIETITSNTDSATVITSTLQLSISTSRSSVDNKDQVITYTYTLRNNGTTTLNAPYTITDNRASGISCPSTTINPGATITCTGSYTVTQSDMNAGLPLTNQARASSGGTTSNQATASVAVTQSPSVTLAVTPSPTVATTVGATVNYTYTFTNNGNVTLVTPFSVSDSGHSAAVSCSAATSIIPGASTTCTATYTVTSTDIANGSIISNATGSAKFGTQTVTSNSASATVVTYNAPRITLSISVSPITYYSAGTPLNFVFNIKNTGNSVIAAPYSVTGNAFLGSITCPSSPASLGLGQSVNCSATYTTTSTDVTNGAVNVSATANAASLSSNATISVPFTFQCFVYHRLSTSPTSIITYAASERKIEMNVISDAATGGTIYISSIQLLNWDRTPTTGGNPQYIASIAFGGVTIFTGNTSHNTSPITISAPFSGNVSLAPGTTKLLVFNFNRSYTPTGNEIIRVTFVESSCPVLDSSNNLQVK